MCHEKFVFLGFKNAPIMRTEREGSLRRAICVSCFSGKMQFDLWGLVDYTIIQGNSRSRYLGSIALVNNI